MKSFFTTVALVALTAPALAQITDQVVIADASIKPEDSERIVVSATRLPTPEGGVRAWTCCPQRSLALTGRARSIPLR